jgi:Reverse transcriptase (RNA-dependent DNA polymerase)
MALVSYGFVASKYDPSLFIYNVAGQYMVLLVYVDDIVLTGSHPHLLSHLVSTLQHSFALKDFGPLIYFLGIEVTSYPGVLHLSQGKYIRDLLTRVHMHNAKLCPSPMITG